MKTQVDCPRCLTRLSNSDGYEHGNQAKPSMGHAMYFTHMGRVALCIAKQIAKS